MKLCGFDWPQGGTKQVVYVDDQGHVIELVGGLEGPWQSADLTELTKAPPPRDTALTGYVWPQGGTKQVVYVDDQGHVIELFAAGGNSWQWVDLTDLTKAPLSGGTALSGYAWSAGRTKQVDYVDSQGHVIELFVAAGNPWQWVDLTDLTKAPLPDDTALSGYAWSAGGTKQVAYVDSQGHVIELFVAAGDPWQWVDLTDLTKAPLADHGSLACYDWLTGNTKQVVYADDRGHVMELSVAAGSPWQCMDLTAIAGAPLLQQNSLTGYGWVWGATKQVAYVDERGQVIELVVGLNGQWRCANLTGLMRREAAKQTALRQLVKS
jgi:catechol 2,3-dioxygenase-like lactoylglutathione lyase family enzyme